MSVHAPIPRRPCSLHFNIGCDGVNIIGNSFFFSKIFSKSHLYYMPFNKNNGDDIDVTSYAHRRHLIRKDTKISYP